MPSPQQSFLALAQTKALKCQKFLDEMDAVIPWHEFLREVAPFYEEKERGRKKTELLLLLKIHFLQQFYDLSDPGVEEALYDRASFQRFCGIDLLVDRVPDESTVLHFRHLLEKHRLAERFFARVVERLTKRGLLLRSGSIVDATILHAPPSTKNHAGQRDPEMHQTKKGNQWFFGMKAHVGADAQSGLIHTLVTTPANVHDKTVLPALLHGDERALCGDSAYGSQADKRAARAQGVLYAVTDRAHRRPLTASQRKRNRKWSALRAKVEHPFRVLKRQFRQERVRYRGLFKNTQRLFTAFALVNLYLVRRKLLAT
ncbi:MAG: IS5 family transposase [Thermoanaerobaculia bacterium]